MLRETFLPFSSTGSFITTSFRMVLNFGCVASPINSNTKDCTVVTWQPASMSEWKPVFRSCMVIDEMPSVTSVTLKPFFSKSRAVCLIQT